jgi:peptide/nickel transport system permease protein
LSGTRFILTRLARDRSALLGLVLIALLVASAVFAPILATHPDDVFELHPAQRLKPPDRTHWLGTDRMGSDVYSRLLFGARITILIGVIAVGASLIVGVPVGLVAGYYHGWLSDLLMRVSDIFLAVPQVVLAIAIAQTLGPSLPNVILALSVT